MKKLCLLVLAALGLSGCGAAGSDSAGELVGQRVGALTSQQARVLGFESLVDWGTTAGTLSASGTASEGAASLAVMPAGWTEVTSIPLSTLTNVSSTLTYQLRLPAVPAWGETRAILVAPSLGQFWTDIGQQSLTQLTAGQFVTVSFPLSSALVTALSGNYSDLSIKIVLNMATPAAPVLLDHLALTNGGSTPTPLESTSVTILTPNQVALEGTFVSTTDHLTILSQATVGVSGAAPAIANFGPFTTYLQAQAKAYVNVYSKAAVQLDAKTVVGGNVLTELTIGKQGVGTADAPQVRGAELPHTPFSATPHLWRVAWPPVSAPDIVLSAVPQGQSPATLTLAPGIYGKLDIHDRNHVFLRTGTYYLQALSTEPQAELHIDAARGPVIIYVKGALNGGLNVKGAVLDDSAPQAQALFIYLGAGTAFVQGPFSGTLVAPSAVIHLARPSSGQHQGSFFGQALEVEAGPQAVRHIPFQHWAAVTCPLGDPAIIGVTDCQRRLTNPPSHDGDNSPRPPVQARFVYADGTPVISFSYVPIAGVAAQPRAVSTTPGALRTAPAQGQLVHERHAGDSPDVSPFSGWAQGGAGASAPAPVVTQTAAPGPAPQALKLPPEAPQQAMTIQVRNTSAAALGTTVAFSVMVRTWGLGNFYADSVIQQADPNNLLAPGDMKAVTVDLLGNLQVRSAEMGSKADFVVGLHHLLAGGGVDATPFAFVEVSSFYYNFSVDGAAVYTYSLERPLEGTQPAGMTIIDGLVERYANGILGGDMFAPNGTVGGTSAADARAAHLIQFGDRPLAVFGTRFSTHAVDSSGELVTPIEPVKPPQGSGGTTAPYDPAKGPSTPCFWWSVSYVDKGTEAYPGFIATPEWMGLVDAIPAAFAYAELYDAAGNVKKSGQLGADGCFEPLQLGAGDYYFRVFTNKITNGTTRFTSLRAEPATQPPTAPFNHPAAKAISLTASVFLHDPGRPFVVLTGNWSEATNTAGVASHVLQRQASGIDMGLVATTAAKPYRLVDNSFFCRMPNANPQKCDDSEPFLVSHFDPTGKTLFINASTDVWTHDARWKFVVGHELGHHVQDFRDAGLSVLYHFTSGSNVPSANSSDPNDPVSALDTPDKTRDCSCSVVNFSDGSHCLQSVELSRSAQEEGFGHFFSSRMWNAVPGEPAFNGSCNFEYYKQVSSTDIVTAPTLHPLPINCAHTYGHRDGRCSQVTITDDTGAAQKTGSEIDWLAFFWTISTDATAPNQPKGVTVTALLDLYNKAVATVGASKVTYQDLENAANARDPNFGAWLHSRAVAHAVN